MVLNVEKNANTLVSSCIFIWSLAFHWTIPFIHVRNIFKLSVSQFINYNQRKYTPFFISKYLKLRCGNKRITLKINNVIETIKNTLKCQMTSSVSLITELIIQTTHLTGIQKQSQKAELTFNFPYFYTKLSHSFSKYFWAPLCARHILGNLETTINTRLAACKEFAIY